MAEALLASNSCPMSTTAAFAKDDGATLSDGRPKYLQHFAFDSFPSPRAHLAISSTARSLKERDSPSLVGVAYQIFLWLLPSYVRRKITRTPVKAENLHAVASLDGLRGLACLFVFNEHFSYNYTTTFLVGYGVGDRRTLIQLPFIRLMWSGFSMVAVFFVISGYVLSYKPLKQIRSHSDQFGHTIASSIFRRPIRLFLPSVLATLICAVAVQFGVFTWARAVWGEENPYGLHEPTPPIGDTFREQIVDWWSHVVVYVNIWTWNNSITPGDYDSHLWTIPTEFRCSMVLFLVLMATSRLRPSFRFACVAGFIMYCVVWDNRSVILFMFGMVLAEVDIIRLHQAKLSTTIPIISTTAKGGGRLVEADHQIPSCKYHWRWLLLFAVGLYLLSAPTVGCEDTPGFRFLVARFVPYTYEDPAYFFQSCGAILTTWAVANSPDLKPIFIHPFIQYLGKTSYALYLVHGNVLKSLQYVVIPVVWSMLGGREDVVRFSIGWLLGLAVVLPVTLWVADIFWRGVDEPCVQFAKWVELNAL